MSAYQLDVPTLFALVDAQRLERGLSWNRLAQSLGLTGNVFTRMAGGSAPDSHTLVTLLVWLGWVGSSPELALLVRGES